MADKVRGAAVDTELPLFVDGLRPVTVLVDATRIDQVKDNPEALLLMFDSGKAKEDFFRRYLEAQNTEEFRRAYAERNGVSQEGFITPE